MKLNMEPMLKKYRQTCNLLCYKHTTRTPAYSMTFTAEFVFFNFNILHNNDFYYITLQFCSLYV